MSAALSNDAAAQLKALYAEMQPRSLYPLWEVLGALVTPTPRSPAQAHRWSYADARELSAACRGPDQRRTGGAAGADHGEPRLAGIVLGHVKPVCRAATDLAGRNRALPPPRPMRAALRDGGRRRFHRGGWRESDDAAVRSGADAGLAMARPWQHVVAADDLAGRAGYSDRAAVRRQLCRTSSGIRPSWKPCRRAIRRCAMAGTCGRCAGPRPIAGRTASRCSTIRMPNGGKACSAWRAPAIRTRISAMRWSSPIRLTAVR